MSLEKNKSFRRKLDQPGIIIAPGVYDCIGARIAQKVGFEVVHLTGNGIVGSLIGKPDIGVATMTEMVSRAHQITASIDIPAIADCDAGYGDLHNVKRSVEEYERSGVSAIHIEDQTTPKKCGAMSGITIVSEEEMCERIKIAKAARKDPNFTIIARSDAKKIIGIDELIRRSKMFADAGADVVMPECLYTEEEIRKVTREVTNAPVLVDICELNRECMFTVKQLENWGVKIVINPLSAVLFTSQQLTRMFQHYKDNGTTLKIFDEIMPLPDYQRLMGFDEEMAIRDLLS